MFYSIVTSLILFGILVFTLVQLARQGRRNYLLEREIEKMRSHNRYLVARYGIEPAKCSIPDCECQERKGLGGFWQKRLPHSENQLNNLVGKETTTRDSKKADAEDYFDGIAYPEQWKDRELGWNNEKG